MLPASIGKGHYIFRKTVKTNNSTIAINTNAK